MMNDLMELPALGAEAISDAVSVAMTVRSGVAFFIW